MSIDYNAAFTGALARLSAFYDNMKPFSDCTLDLGWTHPNATLVRYPFYSRLCAHENHCEMIVLWLDFELSCG